jgi:hypothetical protein
MDTFMLIIITYAAFGIGLLWLSVRLARRIRLVCLRAGIYAAVFAFWFSPGIVAGEGGAAPAPLWLAFWSSTSRFLTNRSTEPDNPWPLHYWKQDVYYGSITFAIVWAVAFVVSLSVIGIRRWLRKDEHTA